MGTITKELRRYIDKREGNSSHVHNITDAVKQIAVIDGASTTVAGGARNIAEGVRAISDTYPDPPAEPFTIYMQTTGTNITAEYETPNHEHLSETHSNYYNWTLNCGAKSVVSLTFGELSSLGSQTPVVYWDGTKNVELTKTTSNGEVSFKVPSPNQQMNIGGIQFAITHGEPGSNIVYLSVESTWGIFNNATDIEWV